VTTASLVVLSLLALQDPAPPRPAPDEPPPLSRVYHETLRQALYRTALPGGAGRVAEREFLAAVGGQARAVAHALAALAATGPTPDDRRAALRGLALLRRPEDAPACEQALAADPEADVRGEATLALGSLGGEVARAALARCILGATEPEWAVRVLAVTALQRCGHPAAPAELARCALADLPTPVASALRAAREALGLAPAEWAALGRDGPALAIDGAAAATACLASSAPDPDALFRCCHGGPAAGRTLDAALDAADPVQAGRARRCLWLRELALAGVAARRHDAVVATVPGLLRALALPEGTARRAARRRLAWLAGADLGDAAPAWESWWAASRATLRLPPGRPPAEALE
jgi:hypothetical protein